MSACRPSCRARSATTRSTCGTDRIKTPADLKGKRVGLPEYQLTACVWARIILEDDHGVKPSDVMWVRGGIEHAGRPEKITIKLPPGVRMEDAPGGHDHFASCWNGARSTPSSRRARRALRAGTTPISAGCLPIRSRPAATISSAPAFSRSCTSPASGASWWSEHPWLPAAVFKAFQESKAKCLEALEDTAATKVTLPFVEEQLRAARELMGHDFWSYGLAPNRKVLETFLRHHHAQGLSSRLVDAGGAVPSLDA